MLLYRSPGCWRRSEEEEEKEEEENENLDAHVAAELQCRQNQQQCCRKI